MSQDFPDGPVVNSALLPKFTGNKVRLPGKVVKVGISTCLIIYVVLCRSSAGNVMDDALRRCSNANRCFRALCPVTDIPLFLPPEITDKRRRGHTGSLGWRPSSCSQSWYGRRESECPISKFLSPYVQTLCNVKYPGYRSRQWGV